MDPLAVEVVGGVIVVMITSVASFVAGRLRRTETPLPEIPGAAPQQAYRYLKGEWYEYHITRDPHLHPKGPYWLQDRWNLEVKNGWRVSGILEIPRPSEREVAKYKLLGEIRMGRMVITGASVQDPSDFFAVIFPNLMGKGQHPIVGTMTAFDWQGKFYTGPMVLSRSPMNLNELAEVVSVALAQSSDFFAEQGIDWICTSIDSKPSAGREI